MTERFRWLLESASLLPFCGGLLRAIGKIVSGTGTGVTAINTTGPGISGGPITTTGALAVQWNAGQVNTLGSGLTLAAGALNTAVGADAPSDGHAYGRLNAAWTQVPTLANNEINILDRGADNTGVADCTSIINTALATGRGVFMAAGTYRVTNALTVGAGGISQRLYGSGKSTIIQVDVDFSPTAQGVILLTGVQTPYVTSPIASDLCIRFALPTDLTATLASWAGSVLTLTGPVPAGVVVGDYVVDATNTTALWTNDVSMGGPVPPFEGTKVTAISGNQVTLSLAPQAGIAANDQIRFGHPRGMFRALGAVPPPSSGVGGYMAQYPWAIYARDCGAVQIKNIHLEGAYNGIYVHPAAGGFFTVVNCRIGAFNIGLDVDEGYDGGVIDGVQYNAYGMFVPAYSTLTAIGEVWYDGQTVAANIGRTDGVMVSNFGSFVAKLNITSNWTVGQLCNIDLDYPQAAFSATGPGSGSSHLQLTNFRGQSMQFTGAALGCECINVGIGGANVSAPFLLVNGAQVSINGSSFGGVVSGGVVVENGATLRLRNMSVDGPSTNWSGGLIQALSGSAVDIRGCTFATAGSGPGVTIATDTVWQAVSGNSWGNATFTPPGNLGNYEVLPLKGGTVSGNLQVGGSTTVAALTATGTVSGAGFTNWAGSPPSIGSTVAAAGAFTTLAASGAVSGVGFTNWAASPPAIGGTAAAGGSFTTLSASGAISGAGFTNWAASPPAIGGTTAAAGSFTALSATGAMALPYQPNLAGSADDLSHGYQLFSNAYGFGITANRINYVAAANTSHCFRVGGADVTLINNLGVGQSTQGGIVAAGTTQGAATAITAPYANVATAASGTGVILPVAPPNGARYVVWNNGANALNVYPAVGQTFYALAPNAPISIAAAAKLIVVYWGNLWLREV